MLKKFIFFIGLISLCIFTYANFQKFEPKILKQLQEVKGLATHADLLPYPSNSTKVSETRTKNTQHITFKNKEDYTKINEFYKNILLEKGWKTEIEDTNNTFHIIEFKKGNNIVKVISTLEKDKEYTTVSLDITVL